MMNSYEVILIMVLIVLGTIYNLYRKYSQGQFEEELTVTLEYQGYEQFCKMMDSKKGKQCYPRYTGALKKLDAAIRCERHAEALELIQELNQTAMSSKHFINYNMVVLNYAVARQDKAMAGTACEALKRRGIPGRYVKEAEQVYDIYILHKSNHIEELREFAANIKNPSSKAMAYYRIARQYYYLEDMKQCRKYLTMSKNVYNDSTWRRVIQNILDGDYSELEK